VKLKLVVAAALLASIFIFSTPNGAQAAPARHDGSSEGAPVYVSYLGSFELDDQTPFVEIGGAGLTQLGPIYFLPDAGRLVKGQLFYSSDSKVDASFPQAECGVHGTYAIYGHSYSGTLCDTIDIVIINHVHGTSTAQGAGLEIGGSGLILQGPISFYPASGGVVAGTITSSSDSLAEGYFPNVPCGEAGTYEIGAGNFFAALTCETPPALSPGSLNTRSFTGRSSSNEQRGCRGGGTYTSRLSDPRQAGSESV
jgi:hypothetical protein